MIATDGPLGEAAQAEPEDEDPDGADPSDISLQDAITHMWSELDKPNRLEWGEGFTLDLQQKGAYRSNEDRSDAPLFTWVNDESPFWSSRVTKAFIALLDNFERGTGTTEVSVPAHHHDHHGNGRRRWRRRRRRRRRRRQRPPNNPVTTMHWIGLANAGLCQRC